MATARAVDVNPKQTVQGLAIIGLILIILGLSACDFQPPNPPPQPASNQSPRPTPTRSPRPAPSPTPDERPIGVYRNDEHATPRSSSGILTAGEQAHLRSVTLGLLVPVARTNEDLAQLVKTGTANDSIGEKQMILEGRVWGIPSGTKCLILDFKGWTGHYNVRLLEGAYAGRSCWTQKEFIQP